MHMTKKSATTEVLQNKLLQSETLDDFIEQHQKEIKGESFKDYLYALIEDLEIKTSDLFQLAHMSDSYGYQLLNGKRQPSRDKVIQLSIGLSLTLAQTNRLLKLSGKSELYVKDERDAIFMFALNKKWSLYDVEDLLASRNLDCLTKR